MRPEEFLAVGAHPGSPWIALLLSLAVTAFGAVIAGDFRGLSARLHELGHGRYAEPSRRRFSETFAHQRMIGALLLCLGTVAVVVSMTRLV